MFLSQEVHHSCGTFHVCTVDITKIHSAGAVLYHLLDSRCMAKDDNIRFSRIPLGWWFLQQAHCQLFAHDAAVTCDVGHYGRDPSKLLIQRRFASHECILPGFQLCFDCLVLVWMSRFTSCASLSSSNTSSTVLPWLSFLKFHHRMWWVQELGSYLRCLRLPLLLTIPSLLLPVNDEWWLLHPESSPYYLGRPSRV